MRKLHQLNQINGKSKPLRGGGSLDEDFEAGETLNTREMLFTHSRRHTRRRHVNTESWGKRQKHTAVPNCLYESVFSLFHSVDEDNDDDCDDDNDDDDDDRDNDNKHRPLT